MFSLRTNLLLLAMLVIRAAWADCPTPNPNSNAPPSVPDCPISAAPLNNLVGRSGTTFDNNIATWKLDPRIGWIIQDSGSSLSDIKITGGDISGVRLTANSAVIGTDQRPEYFGTPLALIGTSGNRNAFVGEVTNNLSTPTLSFPTGVTGYGNENSSGNFAFGLYGLGELRSVTGGIAIGGEFTARNFSGGAPDTELPPNTAIGTPTNVATGQNITCGVQPGTNDCSIGVYITNENGDYTSPQFNTGLYVELFGQYGMVVESQPVGNQTSAILKNNGTGTNLKLTTTGSTSPTNTVLAVQDAVDVNHASIRQNGDTYVNNLFLNAAVQLARLQTAGLPPCASDTEGRAYAVTDSNSSTFNSTFSGGGRNHVIAYCNGLNWVVH